MLRALVLALLVLANLGFFAWRHGWLDRLPVPSPHADREPERLARQVRPETIRIIAPGTALPASAPASGAAAAALACLEAGPFTAVEAVAVEAALKGVQPPLPADSWVDETSDSPGLWLVYMGRYAAPEALARKEDELRRRQLDFEEVRTPPSLSPGLSLGRFPDKAAADTALAGLIRQGIHTARVVQAAAPSTAHLVRFPRAEPALAGRLKTLQGEVYGKGFMRCAGATDAPGPSR